LPLSRYAHWYRFPIHARWSTGADGYVEMWLDGKQVIPRAYSATLRNQRSPASPDFTSPGIHVSQLSYSAAYRSTNTVIHDGFCRASSPRVAESKAPSRQR
jgi:Polysaccharide lyase